MPEPKLPSEIKEALKAYIKAKRSLETAHEQFLATCDDLNAAWNDHAESFNHGEADSDDESERDEAQAEADAWSDFMNSFVELSFDDEPSLYDMESKV